jgi:predicted aldo/keto reductase-like oxidoreductase
MNTLHLNINKLLSKKDEMKGLLDKYYNEFQIISLLEIMHEAYIPQGTVIKPKNKEFNGVFVIKSGSMGVYVYPHGAKTLMSTLKTKEVIGEWNMNFIYSKAAQYEAETGMMLLISSITINRLFLQFT